MRCQVCDYSPNTQSLFAESLTYRHPERTRVSYYKRYKKYLCTDCKNNQPGDIPDVQFQTFGDLTDEE